MKLSEIILEAAVRVPNVFDSEQMVDWLNTVNHLFFEVVQIPKTVTFNVTANTDSYVLPSNAGIREKNINRVQVGESLYRSLSYELYVPGHNHYSFDDSTYTLKLSPAPVRNLSGLVHFSKASVTSFVSTDLNAEPEAPKEYHYIYVLGLCEHIAKAMNDVTLANNYSSDFQANLQIAQQNYQRS